MVFLGLNFEIALTVPAILRTVRRRSVPCDLKSRETLESCATFLFDKCLTISCQGTCSIYVSVEISLLAQPFSDEVLSVRDDS
jgi:hypothetical protein